MNHTGTVDRIYRHQRHLYDATRRFFLPGRDRLLDGLDLSGQEIVLEMGCGTGRNLIRLAERYPGAAFYGVDASELMLATARKQIAGRGLSERIHLAAGLAENLDPRAMFGVPLEFDRVFFSYSLSMMPRWREALDAAFMRLKAGGSLHAVDFWDQGRWPAILRRLFAGWLALFHVRFEPDVIRMLSRHFNSRNQTLSLTPIAGRYAFLACPAPLPSK